MSDDLDAKKRAYIEIMRKVVEKFSERLKHSPSYQSIEAIRDDLFYTACHLRNAFDGEMKIYIIQANTGMGADYHEWIVKSFLYQSSAKAFCDLLNEKSKIAYAVEFKFDEKLDYAENMIVRMSHPAVKDILTLDPQYHEDGEVEYKVIEVHLDGTLPEEAKKCAF